MRNIFLAKSNEKGFSLIGAVVGIVVASIMVIAFTTMITKAMISNSVNGKQLTATLYLQEMIEVAKDLEQSDWSSLTDPLCISLQCYPDISGGSWALYNGEQVIDIYTRSFTVEHVCRDAGYEILPSPCNLADPGYDENTKKIIAEIEWEDRLKSNHLKLEAYVYNYNP